MAESMFVRCEDCNYENLAQHSFCGMCGAKLPSPRRVAPPEPAPPEPGPMFSMPRPMTKPEPAAAQPTTSGLSLLGLDTEPTPREPAIYLLEDEPGNGRWRGWVQS